MNFGALVHVPAILLPTQLPTNGQEKQSWAPITWIKFLASACPSPGHDGHLGSKTADRFLCLCFSFHLCNSLNMFFKVNFVEEMFRIFGQGTLRISINQ